MCTNQNVFLHFIETRIYTDEELKDILYDAVQNGQLEICKILLEKIEDKDLYPDYPDCTVIVWESTWHLLYKVWELNGLKLAFSTNAFRVRVRKGTKGCLALKKWNPIS